MNPAFAYVYDDFLTDRRFERELSMVESELARRGIEGQIARLAMFRSAKEMVTDLVRVGVKNIVVVGNDTSLQKLMWFLPDLAITVGYLPMTEPTFVAQLLGIPVGVPAVEVLAARLVEILDVGKFDDRYFLTEVVLPTTLASIEVEGKYRVSPSEGGAIAVRNLGSVVAGGKSNADPKDGWLEAVIQSGEPPKGYRRFLSRGDVTQTRIFLREGRLLSHNPMELFVDGQTMSGCEFRLSIVPNKLRIITGRQRQLTG